MKKTLLVLALASLTSCQAQKNESFVKAEWLIGTWENKTSNGTVYETWRKIAKDTFSGKNYALKDKDTVVFETILMVRENDDILYIPAVQNQNSGLPVRFKASITSEDVLTFENPEHDFPQVISYMRKGKDSLMAEISGLINGEGRSHKFPMKRKTKS